MGVYRLCRLAGLTLPRRRSRRKVCTGVRLIPLADRPNAVWTYDFLHDAADRRGGEAFSQIRIEDALAPLLVGRTTLIIAHRLSTVRRADRLVALDRGGSWRRAPMPSYWRGAGPLHQRQFREDLTEMSQSL